MIYDVVVISGVQKSDSAIHIHVSVLFQILFPYRLLKSIEWASQVALVVKNLSAIAGDVRDLGLTPGLGRSPGGGYGNPLQYSRLENPIDRGAWWAPGFMGITKSQTRLSDEHTQSTE